MRLFNAIFLLFFFMSSYLIAQETSNSLHREIGFQVGFGINTIQEQRFFAHKKHYLAPIYGIVHNKWDAQKRTSLSMRFSATNGLDNSTIWYKMVHPDVTYSYQRNIKGTWIGGYWRHSTLLLFPKGAIKGNFNNNTISYTMSNHLGVAVDRSFTLQENEQNRLNLDLGARMSVLSHVIRPAFAHPYPEHYLQEGVFHPTRRGMASSILKSGKLGTWNKYGSMNFVVGLSYYHNDKVKFNLQYNYSNQAVRTGKKVSYGAHQLIAGISLVY